MPDQPTTPVEFAGQAAEAVRAINHTTRAPGDDWQYPGHAYSLIGALAHLSRMLPQAITQALQPVTDAHQADRLIVDGGKDPDEAASSAVQTARVAIGRAQRLAVALDQVHSALSPLGYDTSDDEDDEQPCGEGMCHCYCVGLRHPCGCDCPHADDCDCDFCVAPDPY
ncbi:hypothetical protein OKJ48_03025 [Streptomyces kunmingensis]|uniref:Uncharacterized protein n=1 Tax=Streptomyces kunmingensis TaxID=68225 RepID=A0ABU6C3V5_9ACTN|nr:hypothetical protein [Streptomyces kunmingensis]MEB3959233.1 hypothetical protein [Streptomyces kunmingensis]